MTVTVPSGPSQSCGGPALFDMDEYLADMGDRIRAERLARGWSADRLAQKAHTSKRTVLDTESGRTSPFFALIIRLAHALDMSVGQLLADDWVMPAPVVKGPSLSPRQREVLVLAAESGLSLREMGLLLGMPSQGVSSLLSAAYRALEVPPQDDRRLVALQVARGHGLIPVAANAA